MNSALRVVLAVGLTISAVASAHAAGKTAVDPNTVQKVKAEAASELVDKRLDQKITYDAGNTRLHRVISDLARTSGVTIYCGTSPEDWRIRDIPVTVAARDITLRELLNYLVYSTHAMLKTTKVKDEIVYRITQDPIVEKGIADYKKALEDAIKAHAIWSLDVASKLKDIPVSEIKRPADTTDYWLEELAAKIEVSKLLSAIDPKMRESILSGEQTTLTLSTAPAGLRESIISIARAADAQHLRFAESINSNKNISEQYRTVYNTEPASLSQLDSARIQFRGGAVAVTIDAPLADGASRMPRFQNYHISAMADTVESNNNGRFKLPEKPTAPKPPEASIPDGLVIVDKDTHGLPEKVTVKFEDDKKPKWSSDAMIALSKVTGITIVYEDFQGCYEHDIRDEFIAERLFADVLKKSGWDMRWRVNADTKALVGHSGRWINDHENLMPERVINELTSKANGDGIYLEDLTPLAAYSCLAAPTWLGSGVFQGLPTHAFAGDMEKAWWASYDALPAASKELARSESGLKLVGYDPKLIIKLVKGKVRSDSSDYYDLFGLPNSSIQPLTDPSAASTAVLRVVADKVIYGGTPINYGKPTESNTDETTDPAKPVKIPLGYTNKYHYHMDIEAIVDGEKVSLGVGSFESLPFFSPKREKELAAALKRKNEAEKSE